MIHKESRTYKSILNSTVALGFFFINLVLQFFSRKVFLDNLGADVLGLNTTAISLLGFLNIAELGVGTAISFALYKPLAEKNIQEINRIVSLQGWLYRNIGLTIIAGSIVLMLFFPLVFGNIELPLWYAYASFSVVLFSSLMSYFVNYKEIVLTGEQKEYKIQLSFRFVLLIKLIVQIISVALFTHGYIWWLVLECLFTVIASITLNRTINKECPYLKTSSKQGRKLRHKYPMIVTKIKQFFVHKIATFIMQQSSTIVIYGYANLVTVAIYGNYLLITNGLTQMMNAVFNGMTASIGNLVAMANPEHVVKVFKELFSSRFIVSSSFAVGLYLVADPFIHFWIGDDMFLDKTSLALISVTLYLNTQRSVVDSFIQAYGLYKDIMAPVIESVLNISFSVGLGYYYGLPGILSGVVISHLAIVFCWKPYFLFKEAIGERLLTYVVMYAKHLLAFSISFITVIKLNAIMAIDAEVSILNLLAFSAFSMIIYTLLLFTLLFITEPAMRSFTKRFIKK